MKYLESVETEMEIATENETVESEETLRLKEFIAKKWHEDL